MKNLKLLALLFIFTTGNAQTNVWDRTWSNIVDIHSIRTGYYNIIPGVIRITASSSLGLYNTICPDARVIVIKSNFKELVGEVEKTNIEMMISLSKEAFFNDKKIRAQGRCVRLGDGGLEFLAYKIEVFNSDVDTTDYNTTPVYSMMESINNKSEYTINTD